MSILQISLGIMEITKNIVNRIDFFMRIALSKYQYFNLQYQ